jgi:hypothetical protein
VLVPGSPAARARTAKPELRRPRSARSIWTNRR